MWVITSAEMSDGNSGSWNATTTRLLERVWMIIRGWIHYALYWYTTNEIAGDGEPD